MMIHPPMLYSGYTLFTIPFAFARGGADRAARGRRLDPAIRRFALAAWLFLGIGILLGARWSYAELGWGGYWGWDAVENASLMPWLTGTAFLHSLMIQEKRGMLKVWNASLVLATGTLAIMGTFLVRCGVLNSIHAFGGATLGVPFVVLIGVLIAGSIYLVVTRRDMLRSEHRIDSLALARVGVPGQQPRARGALLRDLLGHVLPADLRGADRQSGVVGPPWFDRYTVPLALILVLLSGIGPVIAWRRATLANARRNFLAPVGRRPGDAGGALDRGVLGQAVRAGDVRLRGVRARRCRPGVLARRARAPGDGGRGRAGRADRAGAAQPPALRRLHRAPRHRCPVRRRGGVIVLPAHGRAHPVARAVERVGAYTVRYVRATATVSPSNDPAHTGSTLSLGAVLDVSKHGRHVATLNPNEGYYASDEPSQGSVGSLIGGQPVSHVAMNGGVTRDVWSAITPDIERPR